MEYWWQLGRRLIVWQAVESFEIVGAAAAGVIPAICLVYIVARKRGSRPVVAVGGSLRVHKEPVEQAKSQRECMMIRRDLLRRTRGASGSFAGSKDGKAGVSVGGLPIAGLGNVAEYLIVSAVLFDDVDDVLDGRAIPEQPGLRPPGEAIVSE